MHAWVYLLLLPSQAVATKDFPEAMQIKAATATVRVVNREDRSEGSGVIIGRSEEAIYVLTAAHVLRHSKNFEVSVFSERSYPKPAEVYTKGEIVARTRDIRDLALVRLKTRDRPPAVLPLCPLEQTPATRKFAALSIGCGAVHAPICLLENVVGNKLIARPPAREQIRFWIAAAAQAEGRSGGPLVDPQGRLLGLASGTDPDRGKGYYTHVGEIAAWLRGGEFAFLLQDKQAKSK